MRGKIGSITGTMAAGENIIETIAEKERSATKKYTNSAGFSILKMAVSAAPGAAEAALEALRIIRSELGCHTSLGVSNISSRPPACLRLIWVSRR